MVVPQLPWVTLSGAWSTVSGSTVCSNHTVYFFWASNQKYYAHKCVLHIITSLEFLNFALQKDAVAVLTKPLRRVCTSRIFWHHSQSGSQLWSRLCLTVLWCRRQLWIQRLKYLRIKRFWTFQGRGRTNQCDSKIFNKMTELCCGKTIKLLFKAEQMLMLLFQNSNSADRMVFWGRRCLELQSDEKLSRAEASGPLKLLKWHLHREITFLHVITYARKFVLNLYEVVQLLRDGLKKE